MNITDIAKLKTKIKTIGIRPGEKIHEQMIIDDAPLLMNTKTIIKFFHQLIYGPKN